MFAAFLSPQTLRKCVGCCGCAGQGAGFGPMFSVLTNGVPHEELSALEGRCASRLEGLLLRHATSHDGGDWTAQLVRGLAGIRGFDLKHGPLELFFDIVHFVTIAVVRVWD